MCVSAGRAHLEELAQGLKALTDDQARQNAAGEGPGLGDQPDGILARHREAGEKLAALHEIQAKTQRKIAAFDASMTPADQAAVRKLAAWDGIEPPTRGFSVLSVHPHQCRPNRVKPPVSAV